jgi:hypothetical protein
MPAAMVVVSFLFFFKLYLDKRVAEFVVMKNHVTV